MNDLIIANQSDLKAIADAIRSKTGKTSGLTLDQMPTEIVGIKSGSTVIGGKGDPIVCETVVNIACMTSVTTPSGIEYYYNHEQLPEIPVDVVENYPYILIARTPTTARIYASKGKFYYHINDNGTKRIDGTKGSGGVRYTYSIVANAWILDSTTSTYYGLDLNGDSNWTVWWSNYDIPNGSLDAEEIYFYTSQPQTEQPVDATHFYYNGVRLPKIPEDVLAQYPYVFMLPNNILYAFSVVPYWYPTTKYPTCMKADGLGVRYDYIADADKWELKETLTSIYITTPDGLTWSNYDVPNGSATATDIYFYGTLTVPDSV